MTFAAARAVIVVPCYNEAARLDEKAFRRLAETDGLHFVFVDDGSSDGTGSILDHLAEASTAISTLRLPENRGKAEAVRYGLRTALDGNAPIVGYYDADLATPPEELVRLLEALEANPRVLVVLAARVARMGSSIQRSNVRHYLGRLFATAGSAALGVQVYDTQCGAKLFRATPALATALEDPFPSAWAFDVRLLNRLLQGTDQVPGIDPDAFLEIPLERWNAVSGSKLGVKSAGAALVDVAAIGWDRLRHDRRSGAQRRGHH